MKRNLLFLKNHSANNQDLSSLTLLNHANYCTKWGYDIMDLVEPYERCAYGLWEHFKRLFDSYGTIVCIGSDIIITNYNKPITDFIDTNYGMVAARENYYAWDCPINADFMIWNNNDLGRELVDMTAASQFAYETRKNTTQTFWGELLHSGDTHIKILPDRTLQSAPYKGTPMEWQEGDFAIHFFAMRNHEKYSGCKLFLEKHEVEWHLPPNPPRTTPK